MLLDADSLREFGDLNVAAQAARYAPDELVRKTSGDGIITGWAKLHGHSVAVAVGDYMVLAGTQGYFHHLKLDRIFSSVLHHPAPLVIYAEGGGGRPGDTDFPVASGLQTPSFGLLGEIKALGIPVVGVANGYVFAGNAALLGTCDVVIATEGGDAALAGAGNVATTSIGMGGSSMIEAGGLGVFKSEEIGPAHVHMATGGIDVLVRNEAEAAMAVRKLVRFFVEPVLERRDWTTSSDPKLLRTSLPSVNERRRAFDMRRVIGMIVDDDSFVELAPRWGLSMITGLARIQGRAVGVLATDPSSPFGGAIDVASALKAVRLLGLLARTRAMHLVSLCDTPGVMVGPEFERSAASGGSFRTLGDWFTASATFGLSGGRVIALVLRRAFGLGAQAMLGGSSLRNSLCASWPSGSLGSMSPDGAVQLTMKKKLVQINNPAHRKHVEQAAVDQLYNRGRALNVATMAEIDTVIDPAETRDWIATMLDVVGDRVPTYTQRRNADFPRL
jgi:acetyl-CoA carboxylase carboxyltransferase component